MWNRGVESVESRWDVAPSLPDLTRSVDPRILSFSNFVGAPVGTLVVESRAPRSTYGSKEWCTKTPLLSSSSSSK